MVSLSAFSMSPLGNRFVEYAQDIRGSASSCSTEGSNMRCRYAFNNNPQLQWQSQAGTASWIKVSSLTSAEVESVLCVIITST